MRALADTLPVLREEAGSGLAQDTSGGGQAFDPEKIAKALTAQRGGGTTVDPSTFSGVHGEVIGAADSASPRQAGVHDFRSHLARITDPSVNKTRPSANAALTAARSAMAGTSTRSAKTAILEHDDVFETEIAEAELPQTDRVQSAVDEALAKAQAEHESAMEAAREEAEAQATARVVEARARWVREEGERLAGQFDEQLAELAMDLNDQIGRVLAPVVSAAVRDRAVERFASLLTRLSHDTSTPFLTVSGPQDLLDALKPHLAGLGTVNLQTADAADLSVSIGDTELRTTLAEWAAEIELSEATS